MNEDILEAKRRLPLPKLMEHYGLGEHAKKSARCPWHEDKNESFSVWYGDKGWQFKCHAGCRGGDEITLVEIVEKLSNADATKRFLEMANGADIRLVVTAPERTACVSLEGPRLPDDAKSGTEADWRELAALRHVSHCATAKAAELGALYFGTVCGVRCWIVTDERRVCAEARRMDGKPFPAHGSLGERKAHTIRGSVKSWPVGIAPHGFVPADFRALLVVEGAPDYLAALHFTLADKADCLPVAFLGAGTGSMIHADALPLLQGRRVRFYPHHEASGAGIEAVKKWARQFADAGAAYDAFNFADLRKADGSPVKDLNDCTQIHPDNAAELEGLLP